MTAFALAFDIIFVVALAAFLLNKYGNPRTAWPVSVAVCVAWFFSFSIVLILPLDVSATFYWNCVRNWYCDTYEGGALPNTTLPECMLSNGTGIYVVQADLLCDLNATCACDKPWSYVATDTLPLFWKVVYWSSQLLTWIILPLMESYMSAGDFTFGQKLVSSLKENALVYGSMLAIFGVLFIYLVASKHLGTAQILEILMAASNIWGMLLLIVLLGYGLVDVPRFLWRRAHYSTTTRLYQFRASKLASELTDAQGHLEEVLEEVQSANGRVPKADPLRLYVDHIMLKCPPNLQLTDFKDFSREQPVALTRAKLAKLNKRLMQAQRVVQRTQCQWEHLLDKNFELEDVIANRQSSDRRFKSAFDGLSAPKGFLGDARLRLKWIWKVQLEPVAFWVLAVFSIFFSLVLIWSEVTFSFENPVLSIYAIALGGGLRDAHAHFFTLELLCFITLCYLCLCAYHVIFHLRVLNFYNIVPKQQTDSSSLLYAAMFLSRLTVPLCLNFLGLAHLDSHVTTNNFVVIDTAFNRVMGHMDVIPFVRKFYMYYPMIITIISFGTLFKLGHRLLGLCDFHPFLDEGSADAEDLVLEGKALINRARRRRERGESTIPGALDTERDPSRAPRRKGAAAVAGNALRDGDSGSDGGVASGAVAAFRPTKPASLAKTRFDPSAETVEMDFGCCFLLLLLFVVSWKFSDTPRTKPGAASFEDFRASYQDRISTAKKSQGSVGKSVGAVGNFFKGAVAGLGSKKSPSDDGEQLLVDEPPEPPPSRAARWAAERAAPTEPRSMRPASAAPARSKRHLFDDL